jgi:hypothetical protein
VKFDLSLSKTSLPCRGCNRLKLHILLVLSKNSAGKRGKHIMRINDAITSLPIEVIASNKDKILSIFANICENPSSSCKSNHFFQVSAYFI